MAIFNCSGGDGSGFKVQGSGEKQLPILIVAPPIVNAVGWPEL
jgi:hypothetical protein